MDMLPQTWPPEIDIAEFGGRHEGGVNAMTLHYGVWPDNDSDTQAYDASTLGLGDNYNNAFHTYGLLWEPGKVVWYVNGVPIRTVVENIPEDPLFVLLSDEIRKLGTSGNPSGEWFGNPAIGDYSLPRVTEYEWVRVWQRVTFVQFLPLIGRP